MAQIHHHAHFDSKYQLLYFFHLRTNLRPVRSPLVPFLLLLLLLLLLLSPCPRCSSVVCMS